VTMSVAARSVFTDGNDEYAPHGREKRKGG
jgi:hypothetical protein